MVLRAVGAARRWLRDWEWVDDGREWWTRLSAPQLFVGSFALLVLAGTVGLKIVPAFYTGEPLGWVDAFFTATSAVCVTGLVVVDTATYFTPAGQAWILLLIQLGGLGMITFTTVIILALGRRLSLRHEALTRSPAEFAQRIDYRLLTRDVLRFTFAFEAAGAAVLFGAFLGEFTPGTALWHAVFHSVSAFCNAGFSTFSDSVTGFRVSPFVSSALMVLIVAGGLGFITLEELYLLQAARRRGRAYRLSLHSRIVLVTTAALLLFGWLAYALLEWRVTLQGMPTWGRVLNALFMSVTARTAGFNTVDYAEVSAASAFLTVILMSIGGSPGSTAGGLKTTTFALIGLLAWSRFRGREIVRVAARSIPEETIQRAVGLFTAVFGTVTLAILLYLVFELGAASQTSTPAAFLPHMFEAASAFNTVGLSMGITSELSTAGRWLTIVLMFVGRVGPLTFAAALALARARSVGRFRFAYEDVIVG